MTLFFKSVFLTLLICLASCSSFVEKSHEARTSGVLVLNYDAFGPPQISEELIGGYHWQWNSKENHQPVSYDIKVVVYNEKLIGLNKVKAMYVVAPEKKLDYRYLEKSKATKWLDKQISTFEKDIQNGDINNLGMMFPFLQGLYKTLIQIERKL